MLRIAILTVSDKSSAGQRADASGPAIAERLEAAGHRLCGMALCRMNMTRLSPN